MVIKMGVKMESESLMKVKRKRKSVGDEEAEINKKIKSGGEGGWICPCGFPNTAERRLCCKCKSKNPAADDSADWHCVKDSCGMSNYSSRTTCRICNSNKDGTPGASNEGDWLCGGCGFANYASRRKCMRKNCNRSNPNGGGGDDWQCSGCSFSNFASRSQCKRCNTPRRAGGGGVQKCGARVRLQVDWTCTGCDYPNFAKQVACKMCKNPKPALPGIGEGVGDWTCSESGCGFINLSSRFRCKNCSTPNANDPGGRDVWDCHCGFSNFFNRTACKSCGDQKSKSVVEHRIGMSHMSYIATEEDIKEFFLPLEPEYVRVLKKDGKSLGKAQVYFKTHEDAVEAMEKDQKDLCTGKVNLYLHSSGEESLIRPKIPQIKTKTNSDRNIFATKNDATDETVKETTDETMKETTDKIIKSLHDTAKRLLKDTADETLNATADDTLDETGDETMNEADESTSHKKFKWIKMIKSCLNATNDKTLAITKLTKVLLKIYTDVTGQELSKEEFQGKLEKKLSRSLKFTYCDGVVSM